MFPPAVSRFPVLDQPSPSRVIVWLALSARIVPWLTKLVPAAPTVPEIPWISTPGPIDRLSLWARTMFTAVGPTNSTSPVPSRVAGCSNSSTDGEPPKVPADIRFTLPPFRVSPFCTLRITTPTSTSDSRVTPSSTELWVTSTGVPESPVIVPPCTVTPFSSQAEVVVPRSRRPFCSVPSSTIVPPLRFSANSWVRS